MPKEKKQLAIVEVVPPRYRQMATPSRPPCLWNRLPAVVKIILTLLVVMSLLGAEVELRLSPQLDLILTVAGTLGMWTWLSGRPPPAA